MYGEGAGTGWGMAEGARGAADAGGAFWLGLKLAWRSDAACRLPTVAGSHVTVSVGKPSSNPSHSSYVIQDPPHSVTPLVCQIDPVPSVCVVAPRRCDALSHYSPLTCPPPAPAPPALHPNHGAPPPNDDHARLID